MNKKALGLAVLSFLGVIFVPYFIGSVSVPAFSVIGTWCVGIALLAVFVVIVAGLVLIYTCFDEWLERRK